MSSLIEVRNVAKAFGGVRALDGATLNVAKGSITGLIGPNGSGKTTLFNVITGYVKADSGTVSFNGQDITGARPDAVFALGVGRTFQITRIFSRISVLENMLVASQRKESWIRGLTRGMSSAEEIDNAMTWLHFVGLGAKSHLEAGSLSYGQRKLLELAYILVANPDVILLDEPAGGVNLTLINDISEKIQALNEQGKTFLIVEHNMEFVMKICHSVTVMHQGKDLTEGSPEQVRSNPAVLDAYLGGADEGDDEVGA
jgi:ABC-type branched-subunit amino acid transport system ATPase component